MYVSWFSIHHIKWRVNDKKEEDLWVPASCNPCFCNLAVVLPFNIRKLFFHSFFSLCNHYQTILTNELLMLIIVLKNVKKFVICFWSLMNHQVPEWLTYDFPPAVKAKVNRLWGGEWHGQAQKWLVRRHTDVLCWNWIIASLTLYF